MCNRNVASWAKATKHCLDSGGTPVGSVPAGIKTAFPGAWTGDYTVQTSNTFIHWRG